MGIQDPHAIFTQPGDLGPPAGCALGELVPRHSYEAYPEGEWAAPQLQRGYHGRPLATHNGGFR